MKKPAFILSIILGLSTLSFNAKKPIILILPSFDQYANEGASPFVPDFLEREILKDSALQLMKFPYKKLLNTQYYQVFDKKYCSQILEKVKPDIVVMSKIDRLDTGGYTIKFRIYNVEKDIQIDSRVLLTGSYEDITKQVASNGKIICAEILQLYLKK